ncbi:MAG: helix-turn-helix domain-containing protein, partial [Prevotellaceae bacterium]|nr:helix-turn-helix domain-containing protein [Prevotellaceae bacterium]
VYISRKESEMALKKKSAAEASTNLKTRNNYSTRKAEYSSTLASLNEKTHTYHCLKHLIKKGKITNADAVQLDNNYRLSATIDVLRKHHGVLIRTEMRVNEVTGRKYGIYHLEVKGE